MLFQRKIDGAMKKLHEGSDAAEEERRKEKQIQKAILNVQKKYGKNVRNWKRGIFLQ